MKKPQMALRFMPLFYTGVLPRTENGEQGIGSNVVPNVANRRLHSLSFWSLFCGLAYRAILQAMDELFPERPALLFDFMLPSRSKHFLLDFWIADSHPSTPKLCGSEDSCDGSREEECLHCAVERAIVANGGLRSIFASAGSMSDIEM